MIPTLLVTLAIAAMIALGLWQLLDRRPQKIAYLEQLRANPTLPVIAMPIAPDERLLFRRAVAHCAAPVEVRLAGAGAAGFRAIATCAGGTIVQLGTTRDPNAKPVWAGGRVAGYVAHAPDRRSLIETAIDRTLPAPMLVAATPPAGLAANAAPDVESVPNNHLAYAVQWFFFAAIAAIIYVLAVARRRR
jgi:surfeit locus 1 family protein